MGSRGTVRPQRSCCRVMSGMLVILLWSSALAQAEPPASGSPSERVAAAVRFTDGVLGRELSFSLSEIWVQGQSCFEEQTVPSDGQKFRTRSYGVLAAGREQLRYESVNELSGSVVRILISRNRLLNVNYVENAAGREIYAVMEEPMEDSVQGHASYLGDGIWYGYFAIEESPPIASLVPTVDWKESESGREVTGAFGNSQMRFVFADESSVRPLRCEVVIDPPPSPGRAAGPARRTLLFDEWETVDGVDVPRRVEVWELVLTREGRWRSQYAVHTLEEIGPPVEISEHYGDFFTDIPDGTPVQVNDYMGIDFVWDDGEIVRKIDRRTLRSLIDQPFFESPVRRLLMMALGAAAVAVAGLLLWRQRSRG